MEDAKWEVKELGQIYGNLEKPTEVEEDEVRKEEEQSESNRNYPRVNPQKKR